MHQSIHPPPNISPPGAKNLFTTHYPPTIEAINNATSSVTVAECERMLAEWFGSPVILFASGKSALCIYLQASEFNRYRHKLQVPQFFPAPLLNLFNDFVFPVHLPEKADGICLYHQYGFPQRAKPETPVIIEDIAHSFFAAPDSGKRKWYGKVAIFSLTKFFSIAGHTGGLIVHDYDFAEKIREIRDKSLEIPSELSDWMREILADAYNVYHNPCKYKNIFVGSAYELLKIFVRPDPLNLIGFPKNLHGITQNGQKRLERVKLYREFFNEAASPRDFWDISETLLPFALPFFRSKGLDNLKRANDALEEKGIQAGIYRVDINRNMYNPDYEHCLLLPCHQEISMNDFQELCYIVKNNIDS